MSSRIAHIRLSPSERDFSHDEIREQLMLLGLKDLSTLQLDQIKNHLDSLIEQDHEQDLLISDLLNCSLEQSKSLISQAPRSPDRHEPSSGGCDENHIDEIDEAPTPESCNSNLKGTLRSRPAGTNRLSGPSNLTHIRQPDVRRGSDDTVSDVDDPSSARASSYASSGSVSPVDRNNTAEYQIRTASEIKDSMKFLKNYITHDHFLLDHQKSKRGKRFRRKVPNDQTVYIERRSIPRDRLIDHEPCSTSPPTVGTTWIASSLDSPQSLSSRAHSTSFRTKTEDTGYSHVCPATGVSRSRTGHLRMILPSRSTATASSVEYVLPASFRKVEKTSECRREKPLGRCESKYRNFRMPPVYTNPHQCSDERPLSHNRSSVSCLASEPPKPKSGIRRSPNSPSGSFSSLLQRSEPISYINERSPYISNSEEHYADTTDDSPRQDARPRCRSARFADNPVTKVHHLHNRPLQNTRVLNHKRPATSTLRRPPSSVLHHRPHDPVSRFHGYQRSWLTHLVPGENARRVLRWNVKTAMLHREIPLLQRNFAEVAQLLDRDSVAYVNRERQRILRSLQSFQMEHLASTGKHRDLVRTHV